MDHLSTIGNIIDLLLANYENLFLTGDLNFEVHNDFLKKFCDLYNLKNLIKVPNFFKNPTIIDVMLATSYSSYHNLVAIETGLSDFHKMTVAPMKTHFQKRNLNYRDYSNSSAEEYPKSTIKSRSN